MSDILSSHSVNDDLGPPAADLPAVGDVFLGVGTSNPTDDAPTIISKNPAPVAKSKSTASQKRVPASVLGNSIRGRTLAHFELIEPIGVGGMAAVLRARDKQLDRCVALKILPPDMAIDPENVARFHQEARAAAKLDHENIARVFFCGEDQRLHFIAFEFVEGQNLRAILEQRGRLPVPEAVHYLLQIAAGLAHAASRGVVHRDIKPSNIIISPNGRAKLVDMGLARSLEKHAGKDLTQSGVTLGTFDYISPEQALEPRDADVRSDIYSLGCTAYHMLTGQPPVPEGTAAKKLHHHQHIAPVDPRQLNPQIPDEVAAVIGRMMAKDPKDRYQRAEHLLQHLIQVAQKLGAVTDMPDGVLFVDAALPTPPQRRPLLTVLIGALVLGLLLILRAAVVPQNDAVPLPPPAYAHAQGSDPLKGNGKQGALPPTAQNEPVYVSNAKELQDALTAKKPLIVIQQSFALPPEGLVFHGQMEHPVTIKSAETEDSSPLQLSFEYAPPKTSQRHFWAGVTVKSGQLHFQNIRLEVAAEVTPTLPVAGVVVEMESAAVFTKCIFTQKTPLPPLLGKSGLIPVASVAAWNPNSSGKTKPDLRFEECLFERGQTAVALTGAAAVVHNQCAFGPHGTLIHFRAGDHKETTVKMDHVSAHLVYGPAFRLDQERTCHFDIQHSIFAGAEKNPSGDALDFIRQTYSGKSSSTYTGKRNYFSGLNAPWVQKDAEPMSWEAFRDKFDPSSIILGSSPWWSPQPLALLPENAKVAFQVKLNSTELRMGTGALEYRLLGVERCVWGKTFEQVPPLKSELAPGAKVVQLGPNERLFDPKEERRIAGVYKSLSAAVNDANPKDVVYIKHDGPLELSPVIVERARDVTIKPYQNCKPILTLTSGKAASEVAMTYPALFVCHHGTLRFEQLAFHLKVPMNKYGSLMVVAITGNAECYFKQCQVTLEMEDKNAVSQLSAVALTDSREIMKLNHSPNARKKPLIDFKDCLVRGQGDFLFVKNSRPFDLDVENSLIAVTNKLVYVDNNAMEVPTEPAATVKLKHVTAWVQDALVHIRAGKTGKSAVRTEIEAYHNLFASAGLKPVLLLEGIESNDRFRELMSFRGDNNAYCGFAGWVEAIDAELRRSVDFANPKEWRLFTMEDESNLRFGRVRFKGEFNSANLHKVTPEMFEIHADSMLELQGGYGVPSESMRLVPSVEMPMPAPPNGEGLEGT